MPKYMKHPDLSHCLIPGVGRVKEGQILEGDYARFTPDLLVEIPENALPTPEPAELLPVKAAQEHAHTAPSGASTRTVDDSAVHRKPGRPKTR
jgi:hypothetical protein